MTRVRAGYFDASRPLLDVVIVTARGAWPLLDACLRSLAAHPAPGPPLTVTVVDNASGDGLVAAVRAGHPSVEVLELSANRGFAHACNVGIARGSAPYVLLLNPDTIVQEGALGALLAALERSPRAAAAGPRLVGLDGHPDHNAKRALPTPRAALAHFTGRRGGYRRDDVPERDEAAVEAVSGSCMLVRRAAIAAVGPLDEGYWMYGEDLDWCARFGRGGWSVLYVGAATVIHAKHGLTGSPRALRTNWAFHRSMGRFYRRFSAGAHPELDAAVYAGVLLRFGLSAIYSAAVRTGRALASGSRSGSVASARSANTSPTASASIPAELTR